MNEPDLEKFKAELLELENVELMPLQLPPLAAVAIISHIQLAIRHPSVNSSEGLTAIAIDVACQLQELFNPSSAVYEVLKLGWDVKEDRPSPEVLARGVAIMEEAKPRLARQGFEAVNTDELFDG